LHALDGGPLLPPLPDAIILVLAPLAPRCSRRVGRHAQLLRLGAILAPGAHTVTATLRARGLATECHFTTDHRVVNRAPWATRPGRRLLLGVAPRAWCPQEPCSSSGRTPPWNAAASARSRPQAALARRCAPPRAQGVGCCGVQ
jgi:hypothetical protein